MIQKKERETPLLYNDEEIRNYIRHLCKKWGMLKNDS